jgi:hypothetical protein
MVELSFCSVLLGAGVQLSFRSVLLGAGVQLSFRSVLLGVGVELVLVFPPLTVDRRPEIANPVAKLAPHFRQPLRSKDEQRDRQHEQQVGWLHDVADH